MSKTTKCKLCQHIHYTQEPHECPDAEYERRRNKMVSDAAEEAERHFWEDEDNGDFRHYELAGKGQ